MRKVRPEQRLRERRDTVEYLRRRAGEFRDTHRLTEAVAIDDMAREIEDARHYGAYHVQLKREAAVG